MYPSAGICWTELPPGGTAYSSYGPNRIASWQRRGVVGSIIFLYLRYSQYAEILTPHHPCNRAITATGIPVFIMKDNHTEGASLSASERYS